MICQFCWTMADETAFEEAVPLRWHGRHLREHGWDNGIVLCFLEGLERLSPAYRRELESLGYQLVDGAASVRRFTDHYPQLRQAKPTSRYWFLRWNVLGELLAQAGEEGAVHLDGDVVLMAEPRELERDVAGKTFVLQGCPVFTAIHDRRWFEVWAVELARLLADRAGYLREALREKAQPTCAGREFCNVCAYGGDRFEDQDLIEYLVAAGRLPQARTAEVFNSRYYWVQNPLAPGDWFAEQGGDGRRLVEERDGLPFVAGRRLAFYHFQSDFTSYCSGWLTARLLGLEGIAAPLFYRALCHPQGNRLLHGMLRLLGREWSRRQVYDKVFAVGPRGGQRLITTIVNSCWR